MKILIIDEMHLSIIPMLEELGHTVNYCPKITREEILDCVAEYDGLIIRSKTPLDRELLEKAAQLKFIGRAGAGLEKIDLDYVQERNIQLFHAAKGNRDAVAEHAMGGLLALFNHVIKANAEVRKGIWDREGNRGVELKGKTVGILGFGNMGTAFSKRLQGFEVNVIAYDKYKSGFGNEQVEEVNWDDFCASTDILSIHVPLTPETRGYFTEEVFQSFQNPIWLVNTARGEVVSFETLNKVLDTGQVRGAVLDVLEIEKFQKFTPKQQLEFNKLAERENVIFSPHVAGWTVESYIRINEVLVEQIRDLKSSV
ncbi:NAD(P)-dependent oxidoreductase [Algoriphagus namhaensis]|uniref:NAD(P)-dependent oxidoreductase n=1 Tax=Algoriphagus namhaensis TaxID=915353 RepID=A0ABV8AUD2_9BACT